MPPPPPHITDYLRIAMGETPWSFLLESALRLVLMYLLLLLGLRLMGKRMAGQVSRTELAGLVSLAVSIGIPLLSPDRGLLAPVAIVAVVVLCHRLVTQYVARHPTAEHALQGTVTTLVADGVLQLPILERVGLSQERLFAQLRGESLEHLGQVRRLYMEANGTFSLVEAAEPKPGLSIIPGWDEGFRQVQPVAPAAFTCRQCGQVAKTKQTPAQACPHCGARDWEPAVQAIEAAEK
ncbi:MAG: YetF domain-containing protein [Janthinobacterium lividum]